MARAKRNAVNIEADLDDGYKALGFVDGMTAEISTTRFIAPLVEYVHSRMAEAFDDFADAAAKGNYEHFGHVYEDGMLGIPQGRLWRHTLSGRGENRQASWEFLPSKLPIFTPEERVENAEPNDPIVDVDMEHIERLQGEYIFAMKASVNEYNLPVNIYPVNSKVLFVPMFGVDNGFRFLKHSGRQIKNTQSGKFTYMWTGWWSTTAKNMFDRELKRAIEKDLGKSEKELHRAVPPRKRMRSMSLSTVTSGDAAYEAGRNYAEAYIKGKAQNYRQASKYIDRYGKFGAQVSYPT